MTDWVLYEGDCREVMRSLPDASFDAVVTDPPYELAFMGRRWDSTGIAYDPDVWGEAFRVVKPGGHLLAFGGTRTWHRLAVAVEDAGFEIRDSIAWIYGSGFPKSLDVSKAIDKAAGAEREVVGTSKGVVVNANDNKHGGINRGAVGIKQVSADIPVTAPATPAAQQWEGWGTALKPAHEPIVVARKPLIGTVAENVLTHGTGGLNIDGCRIGASADDFAKLSAGVEAIRKRGGTMENSWKNSSDLSGANPANPAGRWPANVILDESQAAELDRQSGVQRDGLAVRHRGVKGGEIGAPGAKPEGTPDLGYGGEGGASRFFYIPKANANERPRAGDTAHPTVKPLDLMRYLVRLVTPPDGRLLDPFAGTGTTLEAAIIEGFHATGVEQDPTYLPLIRQRLTKPIQPVIW